MKAKITILSLAIAVSACALQPQLMIGADGKQSYTINCNSGIEKCHQKSAELCPSGYETIEHANKSSTLIPHYGEYPMTVNTESLTIQCK